MLTQSASLHVDNRRKETPHVKKCPDAAFYSLASVVLDLQSAAKLFLVWWGGEGGGGREDPDGSRFSREPVKGSCNYFTMTHFITPCYDIGYHDTLEFSVFVDLNRPGSIIY